MWGRPLLCLLEDRGAEAQRSLCLGAAWRLDDAGAELGAGAVSWSGWDGGTHVFGCARETVINLQQRGRAGTWDQ